jgi:hypothetical protein
MLRSKSPINVLKRFGLSEFCMGSAKWLNPWTLNNDADNDNNGCREQSHCSASRNILSPLWNPKVHYRQHSNQPMGDTWFLFTSPQPFCDVMLRLLVEIYQHLGEIHYLHLRVGKLNPRSKADTLFTWPTPRPWRWRQYLLPKRW